MKQAIQKSIAYYKKNERYYLPAMLVLGFIVDIITFRTVSLTSALWVLTAHVGIVVLAISIIHLVAEEGRLGKLRRAVPFFLQFSFGALLSGALIFYSFSSALSASWPLLLLVVLLMVSNERLAHAYVWPLVHFPLLYIAVFLSLAVALPFFVGSIHPAWFFVSGALAMAFVWLIIWLLRNRSQRVAQVQYGIVYIMGILFLCMGGLYLANAIPPVPLSVYHSGVYHSVERQGNAYLVQEEKQSFMQKLSFKKTVHVQNGPVYVFTSIVAPGKLTADIVHHWYRWNEQTDSWVSDGKITYPIYGGRKEGFRGYSFDRSPRAGKYRVQVETSFGQILGRETFWVERVEQMPEVVANSL